MKLLRIVSTLLVLVASAGVLALFYVQNEQSRVVLWLNLGLWAGRTAEPVPVPLLVLGSAGAGGLLVGAYAAVSVLMLESRGRRTRRQLAQALAELDAVRDRAAARTPIAAARPAGRPPLDEDEDELG